MDIIRGGTPKDIVSSANVTKYGSPPLSFDMGFLIVRILVLDYRSLKMKEIPKKLQWKGEPREQDQENILMK